MSDEVTPTEEVVSPKPVPKPKPKAPAAPSPAAVASHASHPVKIPVATELSEEDVAAARAFGDVEGESVRVDIAGDKVVVGEAKGDDPLLPYIRAYYDLRGNIDRFEARVVSAGLGPKEIDTSIADVATALETPQVVGDLAALKERFEQVKTQAEELRTRLQEERAVQREEALAAREAVVVKAEELAAKPVEKIHWKDDTQTLRALFDEWKAIQTNTVRVPKEAERALWRRFTASRSSFEKARKQHFAELDRHNTEVISRKEALVAKAEEFSNSDDWDRVAHEFKNLMGEWKKAGRSRKSVDDKLWARFQAAQNSFFERLRANADAEDAALAGNVEVKEALVVEAEGLLPVSDLNAAKTALRSIQDRYEAAGRLPRAEANVLNARMAAVEKAVRTADQQAWDKRNPEKEARANSLATQLHALITQLESELEDARARKDTKAVKEAESALAARKAWLEQVERSTS